jgi:hypothetical protein
VDVNNENYNNNTVVVLNESQSDLSQQGSAVSTDSPSISQNRDTDSAGGTDNSDGNIADDNPSSVPNPVEKKDEVIYAPLVDYKKLAPDFLNAKEGVMASSHYMQGKMSYPFTVARPEEGLLQIRFSDVKNHGDGTYDISVGFKYDGDRVDSITILAAAVDENGNRTGIGKTVAQNYNTVDGITWIVLNVDKYHMEGEPQEVIFDITTNSKARNSDVIFAEPVGSKKLARNFLDSKEGVAAGNHDLQGRISYPFTVDRPEEGLLRVLFSNVYPTGDGSYGINIGFKYNGDLVDSVSISAAAIDENGNRTGIGRTKAQNYNTVNGITWITLTVPKYQMEGRPQEIVFDVINNCK